MRAPSANLAKLLSFLLFVAALVTGCQRELPLRLVEVHDVTPNELEAHDRVEVHGAGFPQGRTAKLSFRGTLFRPGRAPERTRIDTQGAVLGHDRIEVPVAEGLLETFTGTGAHAEHTTFRGELEVVFPSQSTSAPPIAATLQGVVLDAFPGARSVDDDRAFEAEGERVLGFLGVKAHATSTGLMVDSVAPASRGEEPVNFHLVVDQDYALTNLYGLRWNAPNETAYPSTFVVDGQGKIVFAKISKSHGGRTSVEEVLKALAK